MDVEGETKIENRGLNLLYKTFKLLETSERMKPALKLTQRQVEAQQAAVRQAMDAAERVCNIARALIADAAEPRGAAHDLLNELVSLLAAGSPEVLSSEPLLRQSGRVFGEDFISLLEAALAVVYTIDDASIISSVMGFWNAVHRWLLQPCGDGKQNLVGSCLQLPFELPTANHPVSLKERRMLKTRPRFQSIFDTAACIYTAELSGCAIIPAFLVLKNEGPSQSWACLHLLVSLILAPAAGQMAAEGQPETALHWQGHTPMVSTAHDVAATAAASHFLLTGPLAKLRQAHDSWQQQQQQLQCAQPHLHCPFILFRASPSGATPSATAAASAHGSGRLAAEEPAEMEEGMQNAAGGEWRGEQARKFLQLPEGRKEKEPPLRQV
eukprot:1160258-Pelagomonas_calceolata.AAC.5